MEKQHFVAAVCSTQLHWTHLHLFSIYSTTYPTFIYVLLCIAIQCIVIIMCTSLYWHFFFMCLFSGCTAVHLCRYLKSADKPTLSEEYPIQNATVLHRAHVVTNTSWYHLDTVDLCNIHSKAKEAAKWLHTAGGHVIMSARSDFPFWDLDEARKSLNLEKGQISMFICACHSPKPPSRLLLIRSAGKTSHTAHWG